MWLDTDLPPLSIPQNLNQILAILNQAKTHAHKQNPWSAFQKTGKHKGQTYLMTQLFYNNFIFLSYNQAHVCFQTAITRSTLHPLLSGVWEWDEVLFVTFSAVHQTYGITLRLWDHNRLPRITSLPYVNVQWNVSCSKDTKRVSEDLRYLQHFIRIVLKWLENKFQSSWSSLNYLLPKKKKSAFQMKISCRTLPIYPQCLMPNIFWHFSFSEWQTILCNKWQQVVCFFLSITQKNTSWDTNYFEYMKFAWAFGKYSCNFLFSLSPHCMLFSMLLKDLNSHSKTSLNT